MHLFPLKNGLFWRTFCLLALLLTTSMAIWVTSFRMIERTPKARQLAAQVISVVTITRAALTHSAPDLRRELLFDLASNEGVRVYPLETSDRVIPLQSNALTPMLVEDIQNKLGKTTQLAESVNGIAGFWVSFMIEDDAYWLMLDRQRMDNTQGLQWIGWATATFLLSLIGAAFISGYINEPLRRLATAAQAIARGELSVRLTETGVREIREANHRFNQMADDLQRVESDRAVILAGISHDLRTPLARMLLEVEMAPLPDDARRGMQSDLSQMDAIIGQFLDYARPSQQETFTLVDFSALLQETLDTAARYDDVVIHRAIQPGLSLHGSPVALRRIINNLIENARRYGKTPATNKVVLHIEAQKTSHHTQLTLRDEGVGVPPTEIPRMLRPFTRLDTARSQANGAGLGLAIVQRIVHHHHGDLTLTNHPDGGLVITVRFPLSA